MVLFGLILPDIQTIMAYFWKIMYLLSYAKNIGKFFIIEKK